MAIKCGHCKGKGTCASGEKKDSCDACVSHLNKWRFKDIDVKSRKGLPCSICHGLGETVRFTEDLQDRIVPILAVAIVIAIFGILAAMSSGDNGHRAAIITVLGTLGGSVTSYYFASSNRTPGRERLAERPATDDTNEGPTDDGQTDTQEKTQEERKPE